MIYPNDFNMNKDAVDVNNEEINRMISDALDTIIGNDEIPDVDVATGNTIVQVLRKHPDDMTKDCCEEYEVRVIKNYHTAKIYR